MKTLISIFALILTLGLASCSKKDLVNPDVAVKDKTTGLPTTPGIPGENNNGPSNCEGVADGTTYKAFGSYLKTEGELMFKISTTDFLLFEFKPQYTDLEIGTHLLQHSFTPGSERVRIKMKFGKYAEVTAGTSMWSIGTISINKIENEQVSGSFYINFNAIDPVTFAPKTLNVTGSFEKVGMK